MKRGLFQQILVLCIPVLGLLLFSQINVVKANIDLLFDVFSPYEWYRYQGDRSSGSDCTSSNANCGPAAVAMAIKYAKHQDVAISKLRTDIGGNCHSPIDSPAIDKELSAYSVGHKAITSFAEVKAAIKNGNPVIVLIHTYDFSHGLDWLTALSPSNQNKDLYNYPGDHWLVLKGMSDDEQWFIAYDPFVFNKDIYYYQGVDAKTRGQEKGYNRYYRASDISKNFWIGKSFFEITDKPTEDNFTGTVTSAGQPVSGATVVFSDYRSRVPSILSDYVGGYSVSSFYPDKAIVAAVKGNQIGALLADPGQPQTISLQPSQNQIILPDDGTVRVTFISTGSPGDQTACSGTFALLGGDNIFTDYLAYSGLNQDIPGHFNKNTELVFTLKPSSFCAGSTFLSTDLTRSVVAHPSDYTWVLSWEDWTDGDFNDLTVRIDLLPRKVPTLKSPNEGTSLAAVEANSGDTLPPVEFYFDHKYPGETASDTYPYAVTFTGYDSIEPYFPYQPYQSYSGNNGTDFAIGLGSTIIPAANGEVQFDGKADVYCPLKNAILNENVVKVLQPDGYITEYWGLASIDNNVATGVSVTRASSVIGITGINPCTGKEGFHFVLRNPSGIEVDPFGWNPQPNSHWFRVDDPWQTYQDGNGKDGVSYMLWDIPIQNPELLTYDVSHEITSISGAITVNIPAYASSSAMKVQINESNLKPVLGPQSGYGSFIVNGYGFGDELVTALSQPLTISVNLSSSVISTDQQPVLYYWDPTLGGDDKWDPLPSQWDPQTGILTAQSDRFGAFATGEQPWEKLFLPQIIH